MHGAPGSLVGTARCFFLLARGMIVMAYSFFSLLLLMLLFIISLLVAVGASAWFTRRLETISDLFNLSLGLLSLLGALGANIPNYVASLVAAASGQLLVGLGIIVGSNVYNIA